MISDNCPSLFKCPKVRAILERDGPVEQIVNEVNAVCTICLGKASFQAGKTPSYSYYPGLAHIWH